MFNLDLSKEIIIKPNGNGTFHIQTKMDVYDNETKEILEGTFIFPKTKLKMNVELLADENGDLWTITFEGE